ncbi:MAG: HutD family protein [Bacteroidales bacterium]|nr:HutD family protein [Bacteroidales bacterium]
MKQNIIREKDLITNHWSGGTTTQLAIFPHDAEYEKRNFIFRLSTALVTDEESTFTKLPEVFRLLMVLDGELEINHKDKYSKTLKKFDIDKFKGEWETTSKGKIRDFNLMTTGKAVAELKSIILGKTEKREVSLFKYFNIIAYYAYKGDFSIIANNKKNLIEQGDIILFYKENINEQIKITALTDCEIIVSKILTDDTFK